ncbi:MAG: class I SAM-dependent methyltransferase [Gemmatimonadota bacterium]|nr:class I SAM-dependent methyltransferase [Gemmatimonadota bacterium]
MSCPLCGGDEAGPFRELGERPYYRCATCALVFLDPGFRLTASEERARYRTHENDPSDPGYRAFLDRLGAPLVTRLPAGAEGLDYGSGPGPTLSVMLEERGFTMSVYDPFFAPDTGVLERSYDFVTCTETAEHFFEPGREFARLDGLLRGGGWLGVMTRVLTDDVVFEDWWYVRDPTHVCFYAPETLRWIADRHGWTLERPGTNVALFHKPRGTPP